MSHSTIKSITPVDGRYHSKTQKLQDILSEYGLIKYRLLVELQWLLKLSQDSQISELSEFNQDDIA